ncbi:MAG: S1 RNA-binding domain-containing protein [Polyangiaceae bacterium]|nr:S1 RNA-binding domain-containing protein [Polyangiaceae bacterium]
MSRDRPEESFAALFEGTGKSVPSRRAPRVGDSFDAVVVQVGRDAIFVELDGHRQGYLDPADLQASDGTTRAIVGATLRVRVAHVDAEHGVRLVPTAESAAAAGAAVRVGNDEATAVRIAVGDVVGCAVERVESYGLFVQIDGTRGRAGRGLVPLAELGVPRATDLRKAFPLGTKLKAKVLALGEGKLRLSVRALADDEEKSQFDAFRETREKNETRATPSFGTLGDLLKGRAK